jgi:hypothetical protein
LEVIAFNIPPILVKRNRLPVITNHPRPVKAELIGSRQKATRLTFRTPDEASVVKARGSIRVFRNTFKCIGPCKSCKGLHCPKKEKCGKTVCGHCGDAHPTRTCPRSDENLQHCYTCGTSGHTYIKFPQRQYQLE